LQADLALDALEMAIWTRRHESIDGLVHHSDRGVASSSTSAAIRVRIAAATLAVPGGPGRHVDVRRGDTEPSRRYAGTVMV